MVWTSGARYISSWSRRRVRASKPGCALSVARLIAHSFTLRLQAVTDFLHRDLTAEFVESEDDETAAVCNEDLERCESDWHIGQGAGRLDGPYAQKRLGGLVHLELLVEDVLSRGVEGDVIEAGMRHHVRTLSADNCDA